MSKEHWELEAEVLLDRLRGVTDQQHRLEFLYGRRGEQLEDARAKIEQLEAQIQTLDRQLRLNDNRDSRVVIGLVSFTVGLVLGSLLSGPGNTALGLAAGGLGSGFLQGIGEAGAKEWFDQLTRAKSTADNVVAMTGVRADPDAGPVTGSIESVLDPLVSSASGEVPGRPHVRVEGSHAAEHDIATPGSVNVTVQGSQAIEQRRDLARPR